MVAHVVRWNDQYVTGRGQVGYHQALLSGVLQHLRDVFAIRRDFGCERRAGISNLGHRHALKWHAPLLGVGLKEVPNTGDDDQQGKDKKTNRQPRLAKRVGNAFEGARMCLLCRNQALRTMLIVAIKCLPNAPEIGNHFCRRLVARLGLLRQRFERYSIKFGMHPLVYRRGRQRIEVNESERQSQ